MHLGELLYQVARHDVTLRCGRREERLSYSPAGALPPVLVTELTTHKQEIIRILREDEELRQTGLIQSERQVFDMVREKFRPDEKGGA